MGLEPGLLALCENVIRLSGLWRCLPLNLHELNWPASGNVCASWRHAAACRPCWRALCRSARRCWSGRLPTSTRKMMRWESSQGRTMRRTAPKSAHSLQLLRRRQPATNTCNVPDPVCSLPGPPAAHHPGAHARGAPSGKTAVHWACSMGPSNTTKGWPTLPSILPLHTTCNHGMESRPCCPGRHARDQASAAPQQ